MTLTSQGIVAGTVELREITEIVSAERGATKVETKEGTIKLFLPWDAGGHEANWDERKPTTDAWKVAVRAPKSIC